MSRQTAGRNVHPGMAQGYELAVRQVSGTLRQLEAILLQMDDAGYARSRDTLLGASIGQHVRHMLEFHTCLIEGLNSSRICYDGRRREGRLEQQVDAARAVIASCLRAHAELTHDRPVVLVSSVPGADRAVESPSSLLRELVHLADHGVHHLAFLRMALQAEEHSVVVPQALGYAASTLNHKGHGAQEEAPPQASP